MTRAALVLFIVAVAVRATAQPSDDAAARAKVADDSARAHYDAHDFAAAVDDYRRAFEALPDPLFLFDIAQAYRQLHDCASASTFYRRYLHELPNADNHAKVERFIADMDECAKQQPDVPPANPLLPVGAEATPPAAPLPTSGLHGQRLAGVITAASGLAIIGAAIYFSSEAADQAHQLEQMCMTGCQGSAVSAIDRAGKDADHEAVTLYVIGGVAVATGAALYLWTMLHAGGEPLVTPAVTPARGGATVSASLRF